MFLNKMAGQVFKTKIGDKDLVLEVSDWASQADGAVLARLGETVVLATVTKGAPRPEATFLPLTVDYDEKLYAGGMIRGSRFVKREGRPPEEAILAGRLVDRAIRPLFDPKIRQEIQVIITVLSFDKENDPDILSLFAASAALCVSGLPWSGPIGAVRVVKTGDKFLVNPTYEEREKASVSLVVSGRDGLINMLEGRAAEVSEKEFLQAARFALPFIEKLVKFQEDLVKKVKPYSRPLVLLSKPSSGFKRAILKFIGQDLKKSLFGSDSLILKESLSDLRERLGEYIKTHFSADELSLAFYLLDENLKDLIQKSILEKEKRPDGRDLTELRRLEAKVGLLPRPHGSGLFKRGLTHILSVVTLGAPGEEEFLEALEIVGTKRFMHHYNFPPFCSGETRPLRAPSRREIGHGALVEKGLKPVLPGDDEFPYTIRVVSEVLSSNGSTSMASVCASSLALMDAGVPIKRAVAGIALGLVYKDPRHYKILTDIQGPEDSGGHMDLKLVGTQKGLTACQMDLKIKGISLEILEKAFNQGRTAHFEILKKMTEAISQPRPQLSPLAPRVTQIQIDPSKIREVIGPGGEIINRIIGETHVKIDIEEDGRVYITSENEAVAKRALELIRRITQPLQKGEIIEGVVVSVTDFGAFIEFAPGKQGLVHISELAPHFVKDPKDIVKPGDKIKVKVIGVDNLGRPNFSLKQARFSQK